MKVLLVNSKDGDLECFVAMLRTKLNCIKQDISLVVKEIQNGIVSIREIKDENPELLILYNLYGFEQSTLMEGVAYNLLSCKQIHIITQKNLYNENYLSKQLSISMFFYCTEKETYRHLKENYPDIPYLKKLDDWGHEQNIENIERNAAILCEVIAEVMSMCHMK